MKADMLTLMDGSKLPLDQVLGVITMFTVPDRAISGTKLNRLWRAEGLDTALIPDVRKPVNVFQQACRTVETRRGGTQANGHKVEVKVDEVTNLGDDCIYQVTRMVRDTNNRVIDHNKGMRLTLSKSKAEDDPASSNCIKIEPLDKATYGAVKGLADKILDYYDNNQSTVPGNKVRNAVRDLILQLGGESLRRQSGGVYFVPVGGVDTLESVERILEKLYGVDADFHTWAQPSTKAVQKMVAQHHAMNVQSEADEMIARIIDRVKNSKQKIRKDLLTNIVQQRRELGARRKQYVDILGTEQKLISEKLSILDDEIEKLMEAAV